MNIFGIGIDIIEIDRIENAIKKNLGFQREILQKKKFYILKKIILNLKVLPVILHQKKQ